jgi:hypothetical protein
LVERAPEKREVTGSTPVSTTIVDAAAFCRIDVTVKWLIRR